MRNKIFVLILSLFCLDFNGIEAQELPQKVKVVSVVFDITYPNGIPEFMQALHYTKSVTLIKDSVSLTKIFDKSGDPTTTTFMKDCGESALTIMPDSPYTLLQTDKKTEEETIKKTGNTLEQTIKILPETKDILGFKCKKIAQDAKVGNLSFTHYYYVTDIPYHLEHCFKTFQLDASIEGFILGMELDMVSFKQVYTAISLKEELVDPSVFVVPSDYEILTMDQYTKRFETKINNTVKEDIEKARKKQKKEFWNELVWGLIEVAVEVDKLKAAGK